MDGKDCNVKKSTKCLIPVAVVFAVLFVYQWIFHGIFMMPQYEATASMWRTKEEMESLWWVCIVTKLVMAAVITCLFCCVSRGADHCGKCVKSGAIFGLKIGLLLGIAAWSTYAWMPIPMEMAVWWLVGDVVMGVIIGVVLALLARTCKKGEENKPA